MLKKGGRMGPLESAVPGWAQKRSCRLDNCPPSGVGALPIGVSASQCSSYTKEGVRKTQKKVPPHAMNWHGQRNSPRIPLHQELLGSTGQEILGMAEQVYQRGYMLVPSELPHWRQEEYMAELHLELSQHIVRAGLGDASVPARPTSQGRRCSCDHLPSWTQSPLAGPRGVNVDKCLREESSTRQSRSRGWHSHSRGRSSHHRNESWWHQSSPSPEPHSWDFPQQTWEVLLTIPKPSVPTPCRWAGKLLLMWSPPCPQQQESRSRTWIGSTPTHTTGHPHSLLRPVAECLPLGLVQRQVCFDLANDLGNASSLLPDLASFLGEDVTDEWIDTPCPPALLTMDTP